MKYVLCIFLLLLLSSCIEINIGSQETNTQKETRTQPSIIHKFISYFQPKPDIPLEQLEAHWNFENISNDIIYDSSKHNHDAQKFGNPQLVPSPIGPDGMALTIRNGAAMKVYPHPTLLPLNHSHTISIWFKVSASNLPQSLLWTQTGCCGNSVELLIHELDNTLRYSYHDDRIKCCEDPEKVIVNSSIVVTDGLWHHAVALRDRESQEARLYLDNILIGSAPDSNAIIDTQSTFAIGHRPKDAIGRDERFFQGELDEIRIYSRALSLDEINQLYNAEKP